MVQYVAMQLGFASVFWIIDEMEHVVRIEELHGELFGIVRSCPCILTGTNITQMTTVTQLGGFNLLNRTSLLIYLTGVVDQAEFQQAFPKVVFPLQVVHHDAKIQLEWSDFAGVPGLLTLFATACTNEMLGLAQAEHSALSALLATHSDAKSTIEAMARIAGQPNPLVYRRMLVEDMALVLAGRKRGYQVLDYARLVFAGIIMADGSLRVPLMAYSWWEFVKANDPPLTVTDYTCLSFVRSPAYLEQLWDENCVSLGLHGSKRKTVRAHTCIDGRVQTLEINVRITATRSATPSMFFTGSGLFECNVYYGVSNTGASFPAVDGFLYDADNVVLYLVQSTMSRIDNDTLYTQTVQGALDGPMVAQFLQSCLSARLRKHKYERINFKLRVQDKLIAYDQSQVVNATDIRFETDDKQLKKVSGSIRFIMVSPADVCERSLMQPWCYFVTAPHELESFLASAAVCLMQNPVAIRRSARWFSTQIGSVYHPDEREVLFPTERASSTYHCLVHYQPVKEVVAISMTGPDGGGLLMRDLRHAVGDVLRACVAMCSNVADCRFALTEGGQLVSDGHVFSQEDIHLWMTNFPQSFSEQDNASQQHCYTSQRKLAARHRQHDANLSSTTRHRLVQS
eukprot:TRINITY_DN1321_c1_g1_i2.p1 TRINITY_DN1321_c1_g1~~TRINITY_DN1321_c1_g1_i2.p1  ORF type:complete len:626 (+),score=86.61 TRINITY_DN1321_c1_g1_i2:939-2816(+)